MAIQSLFGPTPAQIQEMRRQQQEQEILASGREFGVFAPLYQAGLRFGAQGRQATSALLGTQDPTLQQATAVQSVLGKYKDQDLSSPETLTKIGQELMSVAPDAGIKALTLAKELTPKDQKPKITLGAEILNQIDPTDRQRVIDAYQDTGRLPADVKWSEGAAKEFKPSTNFGEVAQELGFGAKTNLNDYTPAQTAAVNALIKQRKEDEQRAGVPQPTAQEKALLPGTAQTRQDITKRALNAQSIVTTANAMDKVLNSAFVGLGSNAKLTLGQLATAFGVEVKGVTETEQLNSLLAALTAGQARNLPGALSDKDVQFLKEAIGKGSFTLPTLRSVVRRIRSDALASEIEYEGVQQIINTGGDLNKFDFVKNRKNAIATAEKRIQEEQQRLEEYNRLRQKRGF